MRTERRLLLVLAFCMLGSLVAPMGAVRGQDSSPPTSPLWRVPENLSRTSTEASEPCIVADPSGVVHVFWAETDGLGLTGTPNLIFYTRRDGESWLEPNDILMSPEGAVAGAWSPAAAAGPGGKLHVVWAGGFGWRVYYSSAWARDAASSAAWAKPQQISGDVQGSIDPDIALDAQGNLHVVFSSKYPGVGLHYVRSTDGGITWSLPKPVIGYSIGADQYVSGAKLAVGENGTLHLVWQWNTDGVLYEGMGVGYTRSTDGGMSWEEPRLIADGPFGFPGVVATKSEVLLVWAGTLDQRFRFWQASSDDGLTWPAPSHTETMGGYIGPSPMVVDGVGTVHLGMATTLYRYHGDSVVYMRWSAGAWSEPEIVAVDQSKFRDLGAVDMVITEGDLLNMVFQVPFDLPGGVAKGSIDIYYSHRKISSSHVSPEPLPTAESQPSVTPEISSTATPMPTPGPTQTAWTPASAAPANNPTDKTVPALLVGAAAAVLVLACVSLVRLARKGRS